MPFRYYPLIVLRPVCQRSYGKYGYWNAQSSGYIAPESPSEWHWFAVLNRPPSSLIESIFWLVPNIKCIEAVLYMQSEVGINADYSPFACLFLLYHKAISFQQHFPRQGKEVWNPETEEASATDKQTDTEISVSIQSSDKVEHCTPLHIIRCRVCVFLTHFYKFLNISECFSLLLFAKALIFNQYSFFLEVCISEGLPPLTVMTTLLRDFPIENFLPHP